MDYYAKLVKQGKATFQSGAAASQAKGQGPGEGP
jgi:hypothetical protein